MLSRINLNRDIITELDSLKLNILNILFQTFDRDLEGGGRGSAA